MPKTDRGTWSTIRPIMKKAPRAGTITAIANSPIDCRSRDAAGSNAGKTKETTIPKIVAHTRYRTINIAENAITLQPERSSYCEFTNSGRKVT